MKKVFLFLSVLVLSSCGAPPAPVQIKPDYKVLLTQALGANNLSSVNLLKHKVRLSQANTDILNLYLQLQNGNPTIMDGQISHFNQRNLNKNASQQMFINQMSKWTYLKQIYRQEVSPPIRILQRQSMFLAPSHIDFNKCPRIRTVCSMDARSKIATFMSDSEIKENLMTMANLDPCANLTNRPQGEIKANRCLRKSKGNLQVELLAMPSFSEYQWTQLFAQ